MVNETITRKSCTLPIPSIDTAAVGRPVAGRVVVVDTVAATVDTELDADRAAGSHDAPRPARFENRNGADLPKHPRQTHVNRCYLGRLLL